jgi:hypothetical protein
MLAAAVVWAVGRARVTGVAALAQIMQESREVRKRRDAFSHFGVIARMELMMAAVVYGLQVSITGLRRA